MVYEFQKSDPIKDISALLQRTCAENRHPKVFWTIKRKKMHIGFVSYCSDFGYKAEIKVRLLNFDFKEKCGTFGLIFHSIYRECFFLK